MKCPKASTTRHLVVCECVYVYIHIHIYIHRHMHSCIGFHRWLEARVGRKGFQISFEQCLISYVNLAVSVWSLFCQGGKLFFIKKMARRNCYNQRIPLLFSLLFFTRDQTFFSTEWPSLHCHYNLSCSLPFSVWSHHPDVSAPWARRLSLKWNTNDMLMICKNTKQGVNDHLWN